VRAIDHLLIALAMALIAGLAYADPLALSDIYVVDGDTIRVAGETFRLVGFDAPETYRARCPSERGAPADVPNRRRMISSLLGRLIRPIRWRRAKVGVGPRGPLLPASSASNDIDDRRSRRYREGCLGPTKLTGALNVRGQGLGEAPALKWCVA
jgi:hypothetical protein